MIENIPKKYLPLGSVVILKNARKKLFITGFCPSNLDEPNSKIYDYLGCIYPEGLLSLKHIYKFNHSDIDKVFFLGFSNEEDIKFKEKLKTEIKKYSNENNELTITIDDLKKMGGNNGK